MDLSRVLSGPSCGKALVDLGADVIKVEPPEGDLTRTAQPRVGGLPVYFAQQNCGKRCVSVDLNVDAGRDVVARLAAASDVVLENFRPGVLDRLGLGYDAVRARNPAGRVLLDHRLRAGRVDGVAARAYAPVMHAELGLMEFTARRLHAEPRSEAVSHADIVRGHAGDRRHPRRAAPAGAYGRGPARRRVDGRSHVAGDGMDRGRARRRHGDLMHIFGSFNAPVLRLGDGTVVHVPGDPVSSFPAWCVAMRRPDLATDERFATREARNANRAAMLALFQEFAETFSHSMTSSLRWPRRGSRSAR